MAPDAAHIDHSHDDAIPASSPTPSAEPNLVLPITLVDIVDAKQALRELEAVEDFLKQAAAREPGKQPRLPRTSRTLEDLAKLNKLNLLIADQRQIVTNFLKRLLAEAPVIHISFAGDPSAVFTSKIVTWFRQEIHPYTLVLVGLQPSIAAGCVLRTTNKYFDLSLRRHFVANRQLLIDSLARLHA